MSREIMQEKSIGKEARKSFIKKCVVSLNRFEEWIKKNKIHNFATHSGKRKIREIEGKIIDYH